MTPPLQVSDRAKQDLVRLRDLGEAKLGAALKALRDLGVSDAATLRRTLTEAVGDSTAAASLLTQLVVLHPAPERGRPFESATSLTEAITETIRSFSGVDKWDEEKLTRWNATLPVLKELLVLPCIEACAKGLALRFEREHVFTSARFITDLRPIFSGADELRVSSGILIHTLRLRFSSPLGGESTEEDLLLAMDKRDIEALRTTCERALAKHAVLQQKAKDLDIALVDFEPDPAVE